MNVSAVIPAKAGIQSVKLVLRIHFAHWIPAFAGMTKKIAYEALP